MVTSTGQSVQLSNASSSLPPPPWIDLPPEITADILQRLGAEEILDSAQYVCPTWWKVSKDPALWRTINLSCHGDEDEDGVGYLKEKNMCRRAVDRSQGQAIDIKVTKLYYCSGDLVSYVADRCSQLRCLSLCGSTSIDLMTEAEAVKKLPLLEELHLHAVSDSSSESCCKLIEAAGKSCPDLQSFTLRAVEYVKPGNRIRKHYYTDSGYDEMALAVAKWMPELRHLDLAGNMMTYKGLEAVLDGCLYLESMDSSSCFLLERQAAGFFSQHKTDPNLQEHDTEPDHTGTDEDDADEDFYYSDQSYDG